MLAYLHTNTNFFHIISAVQHYQHPKNRGQIALSASSTPFTIAATTEDFNSNNNPRYEECGGGIHDSPSKDSDQLEDRTGKRENDYMTLKADDVQRSKKEGQMTEHPDSEFKKSVSGSAQPGPQSPNVDASSHCKTKRNFNEEEEPGTQILLHAL